MRAALDRGDPESAGAEIARSLASEHDAETERLALACGCALSKASSECFPADLERAMTLATRAIELAPGSADVWSQRGYMRYHTGDRKGAHEDWTRAIDLYAASGERAKLAERLSGRWLVDESFESGLVDLDRAIEAVPDYAQAWYNRGCAKENEGDVAGGVKDMEKAIELDPSPKEWESRLDRARARLR